MAPHLAAPSGHVELIVLDSLLLDQAWLAGRGRPWGAERLVEVVVWKVRRMTRRGLTRMPIWTYDLGMARAATTTDAFNAIAEPRRRDIVECLASGELAVGELGAAVGQSQPQVSKHLRVLKDVGIVTARDEGRRRLYRINGAALRPVHQWTSQFEHLWNQRFDRMDRVLAELQDEES
jgi:DNA-binding transcriptional ArsR family regulator